MFVCALTGCASGRVDIIDEHGKVVGECTADFYLHLHGAQHSVNYILNICAQGHLAKGRSISDDTILNHDYSIPEGPKGQSWNKINAKAAFHAKRIDEEKYGYILAFIEYRYWHKLKEAKKKLELNQISEQEYVKMIDEAEKEFKGK